MNTEWMAFNGGQAQVRNNYDESGKPAGILGQVMPGAMAAASEHNNREIWKQQQNPNYVPSYVHPTVIQEPKKQQVKCQDSAVVTKVQKRGRPSNYPYLLSTTATLAKAGIRYYEGSDFSYNYRHHKKFIASNVYQVWTTLFHNVILPNAIIARQGKYEVTFADVAAAIKYAMIESKSTESADAWRDFIKSMGDAWISKNITGPFDWYVLGIKTKEDGTQVVLPSDEQYTLEKYLSTTDAGRFTAKNRPHRHATTPSLNRLVNEFAKDRSIADLTYAELVERFGVSRTTAKKFREYLSERREQGFTDGDFTVKPR